MIWKTWHFIQNFWNGARENFLIVEQFNGSCEVTRAFRNFGKKEIVIGQRFNLKDLESLKRPVGKINKLVFSLNSQSATTAESVVTLKRSKPEEVINEGEIDQLLYQGFWDFLNRYRGLAAKKMATNDQNLVLAYIQVREVHMGSHKLFNPIGFKGGELSLRLRGTFISRELLSSLERFKDWGELFVFEGVSVLGPVLPELGSFAVQVGEDKTAIFKVTEEEQVFTAMYDWGTGIFAKGIAADLGIEEDSAQSIIDFYFQDKVSPAVKRWLDSKINKNLQDFFDLLEPFKKKSGIGRPKLCFSFRSPFLVSSGQSKKFHGTLIRVDEELEREEFVLKKRSGAADFNPLVNQGTLALLSFEYDLPKFEPLNQLLRRRVRWLIPNF
ncbi:hypothetical protein D4R51_02530 [bacterium]|nr:MAG: hypothetical protein D4R51_02530 [bacterium]